MFNTYIYGTPLGFDFYEDIVSLKEYFKGLYISSRKGRRLMVNRRDNGITFYNYLRYGLAEKEGRPNSFFGMSISMDNNEYAYNFKEIFDWFDYLFDRLLERGSLFYINPGNVIQYKVTKFKDNTDEIQWLKNNIPNLFTKAEGVKLLEYDSTFSVSSSGQILCFNDETSSTKIFDAFKKCRWIALSPNFKPEEESIEINLSDIEAQLNKYNQQLVPIAISPKKENINVLNSIESSCIDIIGLIQKYLSADHDDSEQQFCALLMEGAQEIVHNAKTIANKIDISDSSLDPYTPNQHLKRCKGCGRDLTLSNYKNVNSLFCKDCDEQVNQSKTKKCSKCGKIKNITEFSKDSQICYDCKSHKSILDYIDAKVIAAFTVLVLIVGISMYLILKDGKADKPSERDTEISEHVESDKAVENENKVDDSRFKDYLNNYDFLRAYDEIEGKDDSNHYLELLKASIESYLWDLIDKPKPTEQSRSVAIQQFFIENKRIVEKVDIDEERWNKCVDAYEKLMSLVKKNSLSRSQRAEADQLIDLLPASPVTIKNTFKNRINNIPDDVVHKASNPIISTEPNDLAGNNTSQKYIKMTSRGVSQKITQDRGFDRVEGEEVKFESNTKLNVSGANDNVNSRENGKVVVVKVKAGQQIIVSVGKFSITINGKKKEKKDFKRV